ncbi:TetR/AcrR family transcriptional regulator [Novosphingobium profundi]|uniref:TetR/AcrR family transcriptional regulator n=1 Tax=Novosphingobium profundi TaxID=1774954 RepID=UPI001CFEE1BF|nr:TetR/AcrR family transcriptional regulator [Novosphingobium profundi]
MSQVSEPSAAALGATPTKLLHAAEQIVIEEGVHALSVRHIAARAGVNSALIRYHFGNVDGLLARLAHLNAARIADRRTELLEALAGADFEGGVDALVVPLWAPAAHVPGQRAIVVLDEIFSRAGGDLGSEVWALFAEGVRRVSAALQAALGGVDEAALAWRIRFVTAAALDVPPRASRVEARETQGAYGGDGLDERLARFRGFAQQALRVID